MGELPRRVLDQLLEGCQVIGREYQYLYVNHTVAKQAKTTRDALLGRKMMECFPGIENTSMFSQLRECMEQGASSELENEFTYPDGSKSWFNLHFEPIHEGVVILSVDISDQKRTQVAFQRAVRALATLSRCNQTLVRAKDESSFIHNVCQLVVDSGGYDSARIQINKPRGAGAPEQPTVVQAWRAGCDQTEPKTSLSLVIRAEGEAIGVLTIGVPEVDAFPEEERALLREIARDLGYGIDTLRLRIAQAAMEEQLAASQRLEVVGRLAGGIAHDFNNLLTVVQTFASFAADEAKALPQVRADLDQVLAATKRATALVRQLLAFSRKQLTDPQVTNTNEIVGNVERMLRRLLREDIHMVVLPSNDLGNVMADPGQLEQVLMNLVVNARDAMPDGGQLTIETDNVEFDDERMNRDLDLKPGRYVRVSVTDSGIGMDQGTLKHVFEPFFTTKEKSQGTGLGLAMVQAIAKQNGGGIGVNSKLGHGSTFQLYLPRVDAATTNVPPKLSTLAPTGNEGILLVEDEVVVRLAIERILKSAGYLVYSAQNPPEALRLNEQFGDEIRLLLTDVVMPEMDGPELAERLKKANPGLGVLFMSGYTDGSIVHHEVLGPGAHFVTKPFSSFDLKHRVREVLNAELPQIPH